MNGEFVDESEAKISIFDSALMFGDMVFEMTRSFNKEHFKLKEHIDRLFTGLKILRYELSISKEELYDICIETARLNEPAFKKDDEHRKKVDLMDSSLKKLKDKGIQFTVRNKGLHLIVRYDKKIADFWPTTGRFKVRDEWGYRFGVDLLIEKLGYVKII